jgi:dephospho-CoA kinase
MDRYFVGITGNISCGKSHILAQLAALDMPTIDADKVAHELYLPGSDITAKLVDAFGTQILASDGGVDRDRLRPLVVGLNEPYLSNRATLDTIVGPAIVDSFLEKANNHYGMVGLEAAILYEKGWEQHVDTVIMVYCNDEERIKRYISREKKKGFDVTPEQALTAIQGYGQMDQEEKKRRTLEMSGFVIDSSGTKEETLAQVSKVYEKLWKNYKEKKEEK